MGPHTLYVRFARVFRRVAVPAAVALAAPLTWLAEPAAAVLCAPPDVDKTLRDGSALAIVTRTDDAADTAATLRVEQAAGAELPPVIEGTADFGGGCDPTVYHQFVSALLVNREGERWVAARLPKVDLGQALQRMRGDAPTTSVAAPVAVLGGGFDGGFGGSRLAAVDARGEVVAWDRRPGRIVNLAVCPGGRTVIALAYPSDDSSERELTVHDSRTLAVTRTLDASLGEEEFIRGMRCADSTGSRVQLVATTGGSDGKDTSDLISVSEAGSGRVRLLLDLSGPLLELDGFLGPVDAGRPSGESFLAHIAPDGRIRKMPALQDGGSLGHLALSPDRRTVAAIVTYPAPEPSPAPDGTVSELPPNQVVSFDTTTGSEQARWAPTESPEHLAWTGDGRVLVRTGFANYYRGYRPGTVHVLDRTLRPTGTLPTSTGRFMAAVGENAVTYHDTRFTITDPEGDQRVVENLWLAGTTHVAALDVPDLPVASPVSTDDQLPWVLGGLTAVVLALGFAARRDRFYGQRPTQCSMDPTNPSA